ncbi:TIGR00730 family Rossman fold protein [Bacillaceae bacterium W0354]
MKKVAVFCGSREGNDPIFMEDAKKMGKLLANCGIELIYGGSMLGCMGAVAQGALENGGKVIGVTTKKLLNVELVHNHLTELHVVDTMHQRKAMMAERAEAFIALPGGIGTLEEWFEVFTWAQIGYHSKPCAFLNIDNYYDPLIDLFDHMIEKGFADSSYKNLIILEKEPKKLLRRIDSQLKTLH